ncbi:MAG: T9SS type A sorting domain-containing protein, partial [Chitinophagaceae bacterium]
MFFNNTLTAQNDYWSSIFDDLARVKKGQNFCLWEYGMTDTALFQYAGEESDLPADYTKWSELFHHWSASIVDSASRPVSYEFLNQHLTNYFQMGIIVVPVLFGKGQKFKRSSISNGLIAIDSMNGQLKIDQIEAHLEERNVFLSVPFVQRFYEADLKILISDSFFFTNSGLTLREVQLRLNGGLFVPVKCNLVTQLPLSKGLNLLQFQYTLSNGEVFYSSTELYFENGEESFGNDVIRDFKIGDDRHNIYTTPYRGTETGEPLGAYVEVVPGLTNGVPNACIKRPVIFVEGIDFGYQDHATGCYGGKCGSMGLRDLLRGAIFHPYEKKADDAYEHWEPIVKAPQLITELRNNGYDLIYLDFHNGADFMENNAMLLAELIRRVNFIKCSNEEIVIIGASMGGQISRFALSYMEKLQTPHCVRNFIAFDSPNQGANIPLGLQHFLKYYKGKLPKIRDQFSRKINRAASRQLLLAHCMSMDGGGEHGDRVAFTASLDQLGAYPRLCRKIALLNGSINGVDLGHAAGEELLRMNPYLGKLNFDILEISATVWSTYATIEGKNIVLEAQYPFRSKHVVEVPSEALQNDFIPGSLRFDVAEYKAIFGVFNILNRKDATCFIPSYSALDLYSKDPKFDIAGRLVRDSKNPLYTPFDAFYGVNGQGQEHMMITDDNIAWLNHQIEENRDDKPDVLMTNYNMGRESLNTIGNISIKGKLYINGAGRNGSGAGRFDQVNKPGSFYMARTKFCNPVIVVDDSGRLELGSDFNNGSNTAEFKVSRGSVLDLRSGATLYVHNGSVLMVEEGAEIRFSKGAKIILDGDNAQLIIDGHLLVGDGAEFTVSGGKTGRTGLVKFRHVGGGYGAATITAVGSNASFLLSGTSKTNDQILQIEGTVEFSRLNPFRLFKLSYCRVGYGDSSSMIVNGTSEFHHVAFDVLKWANKNTSKAIVIHQFSKAKLTNCDFESFESAITTFEVTKDAHLSIEACQMKSGVNAVVLGHAYTTLVNTVIRDQKETGVLMLQDAKQLIAESSHFIKNAHGVKGLNSTVFPSVLLIDKCSFSSNNVGVETVNTLLTMACTQMILNDCAIKLTNGSVNLSKEHSANVSNYTLSGGNCTIVQSSGSGIKLDNTQLFLNNGHNNFIYEGKSSEAGFLTGKVSYAAGSHQTTSPYHLLAEGNYWSPVPVNGIDKASPGLYKITIDATNGLEKENLLTGNSLNSTNSSCYAGGRCTGCAGQNESGGSRRVGKAEDIIDVFPQPATDALYVINKNGMVLKKLVLRSLDGRLAGEYESGSAEITINISSLTQGMYVLEIQTSEETVWRPVLIRQY